MTEILKQEHNDCVEDISDFYGRHVVDKIKAHTEVQITMTKFD